MLAREANKVNATDTPPTVVLSGTTGEIKAWLGALFYTRREFDLSTFECAVPPHFCGHTVAGVIENVLNPVRVDVAHALFDTGGELPLFSDDLLHTHNHFRYNPDGDFG